jgi:hypothetical protein
MSVKKTPAFVCDLTGEASMDADDFYAVKLPDERKPRHVLKSKVGDESFSSVMDKLIALAKAKSNGDGETPATEGDKEPATAGAKAK